MKRFSITLVLGFIACFVLSAQEHIKIKNIPIDGTASSLSAKLRATGLTKHPEYPDGSVLKGPFAGMSDCVFVIAGSKTSKTAFRVGVMTDEYKSWLSVKNQYENIVDSYAKKYSLYASHSTFLSPYFEGDGYEMQALGKEKCIYSSLFEAPGGTVTIEIKGNGNFAYIYIMYEDNENFQIAKREQEVEISDDI